VAIGGLIPISPQTPMAAEQAGTDQGARPRAILRMRSVVPTLLTFFMVFLHKCPVILLFANGWAGNDLDQTFEACADFAWCYAIRFESLVIRWC
jgi:phosphatidylglycerophosphate synthase